MEFRMQPTLLKKHVNTEYIPMSEFTVHLERSYQYKYL